MSQERALIHQYHTYFSVMSSAYGEPQNLKKSGITKIQKNLKAGTYPPKINART